MVTNTGREEFSLRCEYAGFDFIKIGHRFKNDEIGAGIFAGDNHFPENIISGFKAERAVGLEKFTDGSDVQRDINRRGNIIRSVILCSL